MEPPPPPPPFLHHHHPRYVPLPHHPPPPPNLPEDRNVYRPHHLLPPPPPLIQRPSYHPLHPAPSPPPLPPPPIPPYSPHQSQFTYLPIEDDLRRPHLLDFPHRSPARVFDRSPFGDNLPRIPIPESHYPFPDSRPDSWADRPRVPPENWAPLSFDCEPRHQPRPLNDQVHLSPFRTADNRRHDLEGSFRFRDDFIDGFESNHSEEFLRGRNDSRSSDLDSNYSNSHDHYVSNSSGSFRCFAFGDSHGVSNSNPSRDLGSNSRNYRSCHGSGLGGNRIWNNRDETRRWSHALSPSRYLSDAPVESENDEFGNADGFRVVSSRRVLHNYDSGKLNHRGSREGNQEFLPSPRKKIQKKSALLRIQFSKPHNRSRNDEQHFPPARSDNSDPSTFRNRGSFVYPDNRMDENREGSPVELDVSFKSNALVAKAIVASSSHGVESNRNLTARNRKNRKLTGPDIDVLNSRLTKLNDGSTESNSSSNALDCPTISYEDSKQSGDYVNDSGVEALCGIGSKPRSCGTLDLPGSSTMKEPISDKGGNTVGSDGTYSLKNMKKKKVISPISYVPTSLEMNKSIDPVKAYGSIDNPPTASQTGEDDMHLKEKTTSPDMDLAHNVDRQCSPNEVTALLLHNKANESHRAVVSEDNGSDIGSGGSHARVCKRTRNSSTPPFSASSPLNINAEEGTVISDRSADLHTISNSDKSPVELENGITFTGIDEVGDLSRQSCLNEPPVLLQNGLVIGGLEAKLLAGGSVTTDLSSPGEIKIHGDPANLYSTFYDLHNASNSANGLIRGQMKITDSDINAAGTGSKFNEAAVLAESIEVEGLPRAIPLVEGNAIVVLSSSGETNIDECVFDVHSSNHFVTSGFDNVPSDSQLKIPVSEIDLRDDNCKESFSDGANVLLENVPMEGPTKPRMPVGSNLLRASFGKGCTSNKRKGRDIHSNLTSPGTVDMSENAVSIVQAVDTALNYPVTDLGFAEEDVLGYGSAVSQPCTNKDRIGNGYSLTKRSFDSMLSVKESFGIDQNGTSPKYVKKRKSCVPVSPSPTLSATQEEHASVGTHTFSVELPSNTDGDLSQSEDKVAVSNVDVVCSSRFPFCSDSTMVLLENTEAGEVIGLVGEGLTGNVSEIEQVSPCSSGLGGEQKEKDALVMTTVNNQIDIFDTERGGRAEKVSAANTVEGPGMLHIDSVQQKNPLETQAPDTDQRQPVTDLGCESDLPMKDGLPSVSNTLPLCADDNGVSTTYLHDVTVESAPDKLSNMDSAETLSIIAGSENFNTNISLGEVLKENGSEDVRKQDDLVFEGLSPSRSLNTSLQDTTINNKSGHAMGSVCSINRKFGPQDARKATHSLNTMSRVINTSKNQLTSAVSRIVPGHSSSKKTVSSSQIATSRSWHRTGNTSASSHLGKNSYPNPVPLQGLSTTKFRKDQTASYIRKGNSLVRKPSLVAAPASVSNALSSSVYRLNPTGIEEMKKRTGVKSRLDFANPLSYLGTGLDATLERPKTPPLPCSTKLSNCATFSSGSGASSPVADPPPNGCSETELDPLKLNENMDVPKPSEDDPNSSGTHENQTGRNNNFESQSVQDDGNSVSIKSGKIVYVKRKSNQLVAASSSGDLSLQNVDKTEAPSSDDYYKKRKNQIIRKSSETTQKVAMPVESLSSEGKMAPPVIASRFTRRRSGKGLTNTCKPSKFSLVWTLRDAVSLKKDNTVIRQVWPHLFPWKRATHWRNLMHTSASVSNNSSLSTIRKLLLSRKRETIYTRSTRGFSLRKSKVLSVGGSSLKWSKSIERNSKKANEEATLAVAAVEKKKREQNGAGAGAVSVGTKHRNHSSRKSVHSIELRPGERIFRVGSFRYKMDPTRRTLQRISDKELSNSVAVQSGKDAKKYSVPKRLLIGNDEYVRIGNGNQLIRDPKKRTRILASEKVRWSLHTARLRLARKRKYCQFFTRFGKCNKDDGKCPYIHDASKIAVCTKFLKGSCSDPNCKLTHKVIPERMQDCSYFLQGLCSNETCPYRHVNVNPNASICEGFLRGFCADGNECRKKHSYVCPVFEATGICTQGSKCKLHHPKNRNKGKKRKLSGEQKNARGRYFGSGHIDVSECILGVSEKHSAEEEDDVFYQEERFADYIHLDISDEEAGEINDPTSEETTSRDGDTMDMHLDIDELIKPICLMNKSLMTKSSPAMGRRTTGNISEDSRCK